MLKKTRPRVSREPVLPVETQQGSVNFILVEKLFQSNKCFYWTQERKLPTSR